MSQKVLNMLNGESAYIFHYVNVTQARFCLKKVAKRVENLPFTLWGLLIG
jgi:hypothetical protein